MTNEPSHFDHLIAEIDEQEAEQAQEQAEEEHKALTSKMLTRDEFRDSFVGLHGAAAAFTGIKALALPNSHINTATADEVSDTIYETILDIPMLHFMLYPGNKWLGRGFVMVMYVQGMRNAIGEEVAARNNAQSEKSKSSTAKKAEGDVSSDQAAALGAA